MGRFFDVIWPDGSCFGRYNTVIWPDRSFFGCCMVRLVAFWVLCDPVGLFLDVVWRDVRIT